MANKNNLFIENHRLKEKLSDDMNAFQRLLTTMARFHRYSVDQQMNLYEHAPAGATAMATADFWQSYLHTTIAPDATPTPVLTGESSWTSKDRDIDYLYDIKDTAAYRENPEAFASIPWAYDEAYASAVKEALAPHAEDLDRAIRTYAQTVTAEKRSDYPSLLAASLEYVMRTRLGLSASTDALEHVSRQGVNMDTFLSELNELSRNALDRMGKRVQLEQEKEKEAMRYEEHERAREEDEVLRDVGRPASGLSDGVSAGDVEQNPQRGRGGSVPDGIRGEDAGEGRQAGTGDGSAVRTDGGPQSQGPDGVGGDVQQPQSDHPGTSSGRPVSAGDGERRDDGRVRTPLDESIRTWYMTTAPEDTEGASLEDISFQALLDSHVNMDAAGVHASDIRETLLRELVKRSGIPYDTLYSQFLASSLGEDLEEAPTAGVAQTLENEEQNEQKEAQARIRTADPEPEEAPDATDTASDFIEPEHQEEEPAPTDTVERDESAADVPSPEPEPEEQDQSDTVEEPSPEPEEGSSDTPESNEDVPAEDMDPEEEEGREDATDTTEPESEPEDEIADTPTPEEAEDVSTTEPDPENDTDTSDSAGETTEEEPADLEGTETEAPEEGETPLVEGEVEDAPDAMDTTEPVEDAEVTPIDPEAVPGYDENAPIDTFFSEDDMDSIDLTASLTDRGIDSKRNVFQRNLTAIRILHHLEETGNRPNDAELQVLRMYTGFGGLSEAFDVKNNSWKEEYKALQDELTSQEYAAARASTLDAFYTPPAIIQAIYRNLEREGFTGGNVLDPSAGTGRFFMEMPESMKKNSNLVAVELDSISSRINKVLNPEATVLHTGFEETRYPSGSFDLAITNVPFGNQVISDPNYDKSYPIHDYFIQKMIDEVRPGGLVVAITSNGTMDKKNDEARKNIARKAELMNVLRLPDDVFKEAGTSVGTDILVFQKREKELSQSDPLPEWCQASETRILRGVTSGGSIHLSYDGNEVMVNNYLQGHVEKILGQPSTASFAYGYRFSTLPLRSFEGQTRETLPEYVAPTIEDGLKDDLDCKRRETPFYASLPEPLSAPKQAPKEVERRPFGYYLDDDGKLVLDSADGSQRVMNDLKPEVEANIRLAMAIRDRIHAMYEDELHNCSDERLAMHQENLKSLYDQYVKKFGRIFSNATLARHFKHDASYPLLTSLEIVEDGELKGLSVIFDKRTIHAYQPPTHADTPEEALMISLQEKGKIDLAYMSTLTDKTPEALVKDLEFSSIYEDYETHRYMTAEEYLSGDVRDRIEKLDKLIHRWTKDLRTLVYAELYPMQVDAKFPTTSEDFDLYRFRTDLSGYLYQMQDEDFHKFYKPENRMFLLHIMSQSDDNSAIYAMREHIFHDAKQNETLRTLLKDPTLYIDMMEYQLLQGKPFYFGNFNYYKTVFSGYQDVQRVGEAMKGKGRFDAPKDLAEIAFLRKAVREYIDSDRSEAYLSSLNDAYRAYTKEASEKVHDAMHNLHTETLDPVREDINRATKNRNALEKVKPKDLTAEEIVIPFGSTWVPTDSVCKFLAETFDLYQYGITVDYSSVTGEWNVTYKGSPSVKSENFEIEGETTRSTKTVIDLAESALNHRTVKINKTVQVDGKDTTVLDLKKTMLAQQRIEAIREAWLKWVYAEESRKDFFVQYYNRHFNNIRPREYDGSHLHFPGMNPEIKLRPHQKDAVAHTLFGGNTLLAHVVGAGKTFEMQASAMEAKRIGLCHKSLMIMPGHLTAQFGAEFLRLYPNAHILVTTKKELEGDKKKQFYAKITSQDWDAVIMSYEQFEAIPLSPERQKKFLDDALQEAQEALDSLTDSGFSRKSFTVKQAERAKKKILTAIKDLAKKTTKKDDTICFEALGFDRLYVDESHNYKNLGFFTKIDGIPHGTYAKTNDMLAKVQYLNELTNERGVVFASGTPISNSMAELYTLQRYLRPSRLKKQGLMAFDAWASTFGQEATQMELDPSGKGFRAKTRFARFTNLPELMSMFKEFADVKTADMLKLPTPSYEIVVEKSDASPAQKKWIDDLVERAEEIRAKRPRKLHEDADPDTGKGMDNMLLVTQHGRELGLDVHIRHPEEPDYPDTKINRCVKNVISIYNETMDKKSTQLIFSDLSTPNDKKEFSVYYDIRDKLLKGGIPKDQIAIIHDYKTAEKKEALFKKVRKGEVRILLGSSDKLGVGTNVQDKLIASHDLDCPWKPAQIEQRLGRIVRSGNENDHVKIYRYLTDGSFDAYMWQTCETKQRFISQVMTSQAPSRAMEDVNKEALSYAELKMACTGDPLFKEQMQLDMKLKGLNIERSQHKENIRRMEQKLNVELPTQISEVKNCIRNIKSDLAVWNQTHVKEGEAAPLVLEGKTYKTMAEIGKALAEAAKVFHTNADAKELHGTYRGLAVTVKTNIFSKPAVQLRGESSVEVQIGSSLGVENANRLATINDTYASRIKTSQAHLDALLEKKAECEAFIQKPFEKEEEFKSVMKRYNEVTAKIKSAEDENEVDKQQEVQRRIDIIKDVDRFEPDDDKDYWQNTARKEFLEVAHGIYEQAGNQYNEHIEARIVKALYNTCFQFNQEITLRQPTKEELASFLYECSPNMPSQEEANATVEKAFTTCQSR